MPWSRKQIKAYLGAVLIALFAIALRFSISPIVGEEFSLELPLLAIVVSALVYGVGPGILSAALTSIVGTFFFIPPSWSSITSPSGLIIVLLYVGQASSAIALIWIIQRSREGKLSKSLAERNVEFESVFELIAAGVGQVDPTSGKILKANQKFCEITGYSEAELLRMKFVDLTHPEDREKDIKIFKRALEGETKTYWSEKRYIRKDNQIAWVLVNASIIRDGRGSPIRTIGIIIDNSSFHKVLQQREEVELRFQQAVENLSDVIWILEADKLIYISPAYESIWGRKPDDLFHNLWTVFDTVHADDRSKMQEYLQAILRQERVEEKCRIIRPDGSIRWICVRGFPVAGAKKEGQGRIVGIIEDITESYLYLESLSKSKLEAEAANSAKSAFLAAMSHEIRTPLSVIKGFCEFLLEPHVLDADRMHFASIVLKNANILAQLIDDILDLSKVEAGELSIKKCKLSLRELLNEVIVFFKPTAHQKGIVLRSELERNIPEYILSDPLRLRQILINIIGNAIKFTDVGSVIVKVNLIPTNENFNSKRIRIDVSDTGCGIPREDIKSLFKAFFQGSATGSRRFGGTGLGLVLSKHLAKMLGGDVEMKETEVGKGSTFSITIDPSALIEELNLVKKKEGEGKKLAIVSRQELRNTKVLVVEDSPDIQDVLKTFLGNSGAEVDLASSGPEAVKQAQGRDYDIVLMDIQLPGFDGCEAARNLRNNGFNKPIIALSAYAMVEDKERALKAGCDNYLSKPINREKLIHMIKEYTS